MVDLDWMSVCVGFIAGIVGSWFVHDIVYPVREDNEY